MRFVPRFTRFKAHKNSEISIKHQIDMLEGSLFKNILLYSIPLMFSNVLQILFNLSDIAIVGRFSGSIALGSVGSTTMVIQLTTGLMLGIATGINAIVAYYIGARENEKVSKAVHSSLIIALVLGVTIAIVGLFFTRILLGWMNTKPELIDGATTYLTVYLLGSPALSLYNFGNALLTASGDTKRPLIYLLVSGIINVILNLVFVLVFDMAVLGVAIASAVSQYISAFLVLRYIMMTDEVFKVSFKKIKFDKELGLEVLRMGVPAALQHALFSFSNIFVQTSINYFDHVVVEGSSAAGNADNIVYDMMAAFYTACTSFTSQNLGAKRNDRLLKIYGITLLYSFVLALGLGLLLVLFRVQFLHLFTTDPEVIRYAEIRLIIMGYSYCMSAFMDNATAATRGLGKSIGPTVITLSGTVFFRMIWIYTVFARFHTIESIMTVYVSSWIFTAIFANIYYFHCLKETNRKIQNVPATS